MHAAKLGSTFALFALLIGCAAQSQQGASAPLVVADSTAEQTVPDHPAHAPSQDRHESPYQHHPHGETSSLLRLDQGRPWATDAPLVEGMQRIRDAVQETAALPALDADSAAALARSVRLQVGFLIDNCRLEPDADATLHVFIARMLSAAAALEQDPASAEGLPLLREILREYPRYFAHPGWPTEPASEGSVE